MRFSVEPFPQSRFALNQADMPPLYGRNRLRERPMQISELRMTPAQMAALLDAAFRTPYPLTYLDTAMATFRTVGRDADASAVAVMGCLYSEGEIELLMSLRATWRMGRVRDPESIIG